MAKPVKLKKGEEFTFGPSGAGGSSKYPWDEWFNPDPKDYPSGLVLLERSDVDADGNVTGEKRDFEVEVDAMPPKIKSAARKRYKVCQVSRRDAHGNRLENALIIQARDMTPEERQEEDLLRAEEREALKAKKAKVSSNGQAATAAPTPVPEPAQA